MTFRPGAVAGVALVALVALSGCSSAGPAPGRSRTAPSTAAVPSTPATTAAPTTVPSTALAPTPGRPSAPASSPNLTSRAPSGTGTTGPPVATSGPRSTCTSLVIRVIRGSAAEGFEFAALQFVNTGTSACVLNGYPTVTLRRAGSAVGTPSRPAGTAPSRFALGPGATAESRLKDFSSCQAPLSDEIRVVAPGSRISLTRPGQLRACTMRVSPLAAPE